MMIKPVKCHLRIAGVRYSTDIRSPYADSEDAEQKYITRSYLHVCVYLSIRKA